MNFESKFYSRNLHVGLFQTGQQEFQQMEEAKRETSLTVKDDRGPNINLAVSTESHKRFFL